MSPSQCGLKAILVGVVKVYFHEMQVTGTLTFLKTANGAEAHLFSKGSKWVAQYTTLEDAITCALLANAVTSDQEQAFLAAAEDRAPMEIRVNVDEFTLVRVGFSAADAKQALKLQA